MILILDARAACRRTQPSWLRIHFSLSSIPRIWQDAPNSEFELMQPGEPENGRRFFPSGALFFFAVLIAFYAALWLVIYWIMIARA